MSKQTKMAPSSADARAVLSEMLCAFEAFKDANDRRLAEIERKSSADVLSIDKVDRIDRALARHEAALDRLRLAQRRPGLGGAPAYVADGRKAAFDAYVRKGEVSGLYEAKDLVSGTPSAGGYLVPDTTEREVARRLAAISPIRAIATVRETSGSAYKKPISIGGATSGWVAETDARTGTDEPTLSIIDVPAAELYAMPAASPTLLEDAAVDIDAWLASEIEEVFAVAEGKAFISGDGDGEPHGFLGYTTKAEGVAVWGEMSYIATGAAGAFPASNPADKLLDLIYTPKAPYRANARFVMNRKTVSAVRKFKDTDGDYIWKPAQAIGGESSLFGYPLTEAEDMPDVAADKYAVAFGDFAKGYLVVDRLGMSVLRDPFSAKPYVLFYTRKRVGGAVQDFDAVKLLKFAAA